MSHIIVAYHTKDDLYTKSAARLKDSMDKLGLVYDITQIESMGDWYKNTQYKPRFIKSMLKKHQGVNLVYVDADAVFLQNPNLFDVLDNKTDVNVAAFLLQHSKYRNKSRSPELLSGTLYFKNNDLVMGMVDKWINACSVSKIWDQVALSKVLGNCFYHLPDEYCVIFDYMSSVQNPVIKHFQASRVAKNK